MREGVAPGMALRNLKGASIGEIQQRGDGKNCQSLILRRAFLRREHFGTCPFQSLSLAGIRLYFVRPHFSSLNVWADLSLLTFRNLPVFPAPKGLRDLRKYRIKAFSVANPAEPRCEIKDYIVQIWAVKNF